MNPDTALELVQKSFRVTLGATASLIESLQDPQRRDENLGKLRLDLSELTEELAAKGEMTEQEARNFVDTLFRQYTSQSAPSSYTPPSSTPAETTTAPTPPSSDVQLELQELTAQIAAIRAELEKLREQDQ